MTTSKPTQVSTTTTCSLPWITFANSFPITSNRLIPCQLDHTLFRVTAMFRRVSECPCHQCRELSGPMHRSPLLIASGLTGWSPALPLCMSITPFQTHLLACISISTCWAFSWNQAFFAHLIFSLADVSLPVSMIVRA